MAEEKAAADAAAAGTAAPATSNSKPIVLYILVVINMLVVGGVGFMLWKNSKKPVATIDGAIAGVEKDDKAEKETPVEIGRNVPLETFLVNLAGSKGRKVLKVNIELEVKGQDIIQEVDSRKAQIRDFIIIILSSKTYDEISVKAGVDALRNEIKDNINSFLSKGKIVNVYFTEFIYN